MSDSTTPGGSSSLSVTISSFEGREITDISKMVLECVIRESLFEPGITASLLIADAISLRSFLPIIGDERVKITIRSGGRDSYPIDLEFHLYKVDNITPVKDRTEMYSLELVSPGLMFDITRVVNTAFTAMTAESIVKSIFNRYISSYTNQSLGELEPCRGLHQFTFPRMSPIRAIALVTSESVSIKHPLSMMLFYEGIDGYNFRSIASMFQQRPREIYYWTHQNLEHDKTKTLKLGELAIQRNQIMLEYSQSGSVDTLRGLMEGQYGMSLYKLDPIQKTFSTSSYQINKDFQKVDHVGSSHEPTHATIAGVGQNFDRSQLAHGRYHITVSPPSPFMRGRPGASFPRTRTNSLVHTLPTFFQLHNTTFDVAVPGNSNMRAGQIVKLVFPELTSIERTRKTNAAVTGHYLVTNVTHRKNKQGYSTVIQCMRDTFAQPIKNISPETQNLIPNNTHPTDGDRT